MADALADILDAKCAVYEDGADGWAEDERRWYGGRAVRDELVQFRGEDSTHWEQRKKQARYLNFPALHTRTLAGHISRIAPMPNFGTLLGEDVRTGKPKAIRPRGSFTLTDASAAELIYYNANGIGNNGLQWPAWWDGVQTRAMVTGHRWIFVESPPRLTETVSPYQRPYLVEWSPLRVPYFEHDDTGVLLWAVVRVPVRAPRLSAEGWTADAKGYGYYLLVRKGYRDLPEPYGDGKGGWWIFDADKKPVRSGAWDSTGGEIPLFPLVAEPSGGIDAVEEADAIAAMSRSSTTELGAIAVDLMNRVSERNYDAADAARSGKFILGTDPENPGLFNVTTASETTGGITHPVPAWYPGGDKTKAPVIPTIYDSSAGAIPAEVYEKIIGPTIEDARVVMVQQVTSTPDSSGRSKEIGFTEGVSPLLVMLVAHRETAENTALHFLERRNGAEQPTGSVKYPDDVQIRDVVASVHDAVDLIQRAGLRMARTSARLVVKGLQRGGALNEDELKDAEVEATAAGQAAERERDELRDILREPPPPNGDGNGDAPARRGRRRNLTITDPEGNVLKRIREEQEE